MKYSIIALFLFAFLGAFAQSEINHTEFQADSLEHVLATTTTYQDSIEIYLNIYDLKPRADAEKYAKIMLELAKNRNDVDLVMEMCCQLAFINVRNDSILEDLERQVSRYPNTKKQRIASTYIALRRAGNAAYYAGDGKRLEKIQEAISNQFGNTNNDIYDQIRNLGTVCILMGSVTAHHGLQSTYVQRLIDLTPQLTEDDLYLKNVIFNYASNIYTNLSMGEQAINAARERIKTLDHMTEKFRKEGRVNYNFKFHYYQAYRILFYNYELLTPAEIDDLHAKIQDLRENNLDVRGEYERGGTQAFYLMAKGRYEEAIPLFKEIAASNDPLTKFQKRRALQQLIKAAEKIGDDALLADATKQYAALLERIIEEDAQSSQEEMRILYDVSDLESQNDRFKERIVIILSSAGVLMAIIIIALLLLFMRNRRLSKKLITANHDLEAERDDLRKTGEDLIAARDKATKAERQYAEFLSNISHEIINPMEAICEYSQLIVDCTDTKGKKYLRKYADIVNLNAELFSRIINDIFEIGALEDNRMFVKLQPASVNDMCRLAVQTVEHRLEEGVKLIFTKADEPDTIITTDSKRVEQVLINLLTNATKFTKEGTITCDYEVHKDENRIDFIVTDTGIGVPDGKEEIIFERFQKADKTSQGIGLGLTISRMIAEVLHGSIHLDKSYNKGARFIFSIPIN